jgi:very-short-patch-repair endonuclease/DNA-directed RNA polymerase subunit RPC12/RpoP
MATFDSHPKSKFWSDRNTFKPNEVALNSHKKFWFNCGECGHPFESNLKNINLLNRWCPYCSNKKLCNFISRCKICFNKSFASIEYSENWSDKNEDLPEEVFKNSHKEYLFDCPKCNHTFKQKLSHITRGNTCNYCHNLVMCSPDKNCISCINKSFASMERSKNWSHKNKKKPIEVFKSSAEKFIFDCDKCVDDFESKLCHITDGSWCPNCRYKTEDKLNKILTGKYPSLKTQYKVDWCKDKKHLPFDFVIEERKIIVEQDGVQHWKQVAKWKTPQHNRCRDLYKMKCANENGFSVIRILQEDIFKDKYDWINELCENIEKITNEKRVQNIYMCKKNEYKDFIDI